MEWADRAMGEKQKGKIDTARNLFAKAAVNERDAAMQFLTDFEFEPSRAILFRSAATLFFESGDMQAAERMAGFGLGGSNTPEWVADEIRSLLERVHFQRHLAIGGLVLGDADVQISMAGDSIADGMAPADLVNERIDAFGKMAIRTSQRLSGFPFQEVIKGSRSSEPDFIVMLSTPRQQCFAMTARIAGPKRQPALPGMHVAPSFTVHEIIQCLSMFESRKDDDLQVRITDPAYRRNFVGLASRLAPDGTALKMVGFTAIVDGGERSVALTVKRRDHHDRLRQITDGAVVADQIEVVGYLQYADKLTRGVVKIKPESGNPVTFQVQEGMLNDIVRPLWDCKVIASGELVSRRSKSYKLIDIGPFGRDSE